jgi:two-component system response regulator (stage 0 sporulation protein F)
MVNILVVDDQPHLQEFFNEELANEGYNFKSAMDVESARRYLKDSKPDVVLLDLYLDGFEGWNVLHEIKHEYPYLPVLIVTAYDNYADDPRLSEADGYVIKSFGALGKLKQKIDDAVS